MLLYLCQDGAGPSGVAAYGYAVLRHRADARMLLLNATHPPPAAPAAVHERITTLPEESSHDPSAVARVIAELVAGGDDRVTLVPNTGDTPWAATLAFLRAAPATVRSRVRVLGVVHSDMETQYGIAVHYQPIAPIWIGVSRRCADELRKRLSRTSASVHELHCPVEVRDERSAPRGDGPLRVAYVGRLEEPQKRVSRLVDLFRELVRLGLDFQATVAGDGPAAPAFATALNAAGPDVTARVTLGGAVDREHVDAIWRTHDVCLLVSAYEGLPLALLEAMASGVCPVVMAVESGLPDLLRDRRNARVVSQGDVGAMAEALCALDRDRSRLESLGRSARVSVTSGFSPDRHFARLSAILDECWAQPQPSPSVAIADPTANAIANSVRRMHSVARPVAVYGSGMFGRKVVDACLAAGIPVCALFDSDPARAGVVYRGLQCAPPEALSEYPDALFVTGSLQFADAMAERIRAEFAARGRPAPAVLNTTP